MVWGLIRSTEAMCFLCVWVLERCLPEIVVRRGQRASRSELGLDWMLQGGYLHGWTEDSRVWGRDLECRAMGPVLGF